MIARSQALRFGLGLAAALLASAPWLVGADVPYEAQTGERASAYSNPVLSLEALAARPFFDPSRKPDVTSAPQSAKSAAPVALSDLYSVSGVVHGLGAQIVIVAQRTTAKNLRLAPGESLDGYTLEAVEPDAVVFQGSAGRIRLPRPQAQN